MVSLLAHKNLHKTLVTEDQFKDEQHKVIAKSGAIQQLEQRAATASRERTLQKNPLGKTAKMDGSNNSFFGDRKRR
jgi:hypothetical protein